jgi:hypothetical protein
MSFQAKILITIVAVIAFEALQCLASRVFLVDYVNLGWNSFGVYAAAGYWGAHGRTFKWGVLLALLAGIANATIGWLVLAIIPPFTRIGIAPLHPLLFAIANALIIARALFTGLVGAGFCALTGHTRTADAEQIVGRERRERVSQVDSSGDA